MKCMADLCVIPIGSGVSVAEHITECQRVLARFPIESRLHAYGTNLYGEWDDVFAAIKACHERLHDQGVVRLSSSIKVGTRTDKAQSFDDKIDAVESRL
ncbi:MAG: MTH1187 family thiamine-binding protein [Saccharospirillum sp.]